MTSPLINLMVLCYLMCIAEGSDDGGSLAEFLLIYTKYNKETPQEEQWQLSAEWIELNNRSTVTLPKLIKKQDDVSPFGKSRCTRYCTGTRDVNGGSSVRRINLFWSIADDANETESLVLEDFLKTTSEKIYDDSDINRNCQVYLYLDCEVVEAKKVLNKNAGYSFELNNFGIVNETKTDFENSEFTKLVESSELTGYTETKFHVDQFATRIRIFIWGNISRVILEIPLTSETPSGITIILSFVAKGVRIDAWDAPPGGWWLKLSGVGNSRYRFRVESRRDSTEETDYDGKKQGDVELIDLSRYPKAISERSSENDASISTESTLAKESNASLFMRMTDAANKELSVAKFSDDFIERRKMLVEINVKSDLIATPGTIHRILFDVSNNCLLPVRYAFRAKSSQFRIYNVQPLYTWVYPGQTNHVAVDIVVPSGINSDTANTITLYAEGTDITEKSVYLYVEQSIPKANDDTRPTIEYTFNNNCAGKLSKDRCSKSQWSVDITVQDADSGLKRVTSTPNDVSPRREFISGTRETITFYYSATCCATTAKITAVDLMDNSNVVTIDVTAWDNLSEAQIASITLGALLLLLFIIFIILLVAYCVRRRNSHDLPYTQRYGSRPPTDKPEEISRRIPAGFIGFRRPRISRLAMGVKDLWNILSPLGERKPLFELQGKVVAIDLSCWVVDSQNVAENSAQPKMYLRNLFFRTAGLLSQEILPVFVLEGTPPALKHKTIARRNDARNKFRERKVKQKTERRQFKRILNECKELLRCMGLVCAQGEGEAEAMCADLNACDLVDGCISQDSDCFLYGAKVVYRNFCMSAQGNRGAPGGSVDEYDMEKIQRVSNLGRNKMIALALLCGCDYDEGVNGVGKGAALKLFDGVEDDCILDRLRNWRSDNSFDELENKLMDPNICTSCGHKGKVQKHAKSGCEDCGTSTKCDTTYKETRTTMLNEITLRKKALAKDDFPNECLIEEFLSKKDWLTAHMNFRWRQPQIKDFINFMERQLCWEPQYAFEKIFPLTTRWQVQRLPDVSMENRLTISDLFIPEYIKKIRNIRSVASYEIIWKNDHVVVEELKRYYMENKETDDDEEILKELTTIEPSKLVEKCYPEVVENFNSLRTTKPKKRTGNSRKKKADKNGDEIDDANKENNTKQRRNRRKNRQSRGNKKLDDFIKVNRPLSLEESFEKMTITPKRSKREENPNEKKSFDNSLDRMFNDLSSDDFPSEDEQSNLNMTDVIQDICKGRMLTYSFIKSPTRTDLKEILKEEILKEEIRETSEDKETCLDEEEIEEMKDDPFDEFGDIDENYVPITVRVKTQETKSVPSVVANGNRFTLGFNDLMDESDTKDMENQEISS